MKFSLLPKENIFYQYLMQLANQAKTAALLFRELLDSWNLTHPHLKKLKDIEHECDQVVHAIMVKLNKTFITPIDREDIHHLAKKMDDIVDTIQALSERMVLFQIQTVTGDLKAMVQVLDQILDIIQMTLPLIKELKDPNKVFDLCIQIHTLENQGDRLFEKAIGSLFMNTPDPLEIIKWKEIYDFLEKTIDTGEDIADILWGIVVKYG